MYIDTKQYTLPAMLCWGQGQLILKLKFHLQDGLAVVIFFNHAVPSTNQTHKIKF